MTYTPRQRIRLTPDFASLLARLNPSLSMREFAARADVSYATLRGAIDPTQQPNNRSPKGGIYETTARKIARAYAAAKQISEDDAYNEIISVEQRRYRRKAAEAARV